MRRLLSVSWFRALCLTALVAACGSAWADPPGRVGRLGEMRGTVWFYDADQREWVEAEHNRPVTEGDRLATDHGAHAEVRIGSTTVRLAGDTQLQFTELDDDRIHLQLDEGAVAARIRQHDAADDFEVDTADGRFQPMQPGHYRIDRDDDNSAAMVWQGQLRFDASDSTLVVGRGQRAEFWREDGATHYSWAAPPDDGFADWALDADRRDERYARSRYVSPEMTGWEDLDRDGRWETHPEYGAVWVPVHVVAGWAPYRYGHWAWVRPWGWTWVDDAPWGFAPFHYGRWLWWGGHWCWTPGAYVARPVYAPALVAWVGGPQVSVSVTVGSPPLVGWVPLAPRETYYPSYPVPPAYWRVLNPHAPTRTYRPAPPVQGPIMYTNRGVPGGVTVVPADALKQRQPIANVVSRVDPRSVRALIDKPAVVHQPPPPPTGVTVSRPGIGAAEHGPGEPRVAPGAVKVPPPPSSVSRPGRPERAIDDERAPKGNARGVGTPPPPRPVTPPNAPAQPRNVPLPQGVSPAQPAAPASPARDRDADERRPSPGAERRSAVPPPPRRAVTPAAEPVMPSPPAQRGGGAEPVRAMPPPAGRHDDEARGRRGGEPREVREPAREAPREVPRDAREGAREAPRGNGGNGGGDRGDRGDRRENPGGGRAQPY